ncbi:phospholipase A and acyltransferase 5 isoform X2 [Castor canadensis]|uniref:Phospholipase A and acyltransferase 5 isoform X2 n=1 Tax=Castor canadensis TaxID=51338 RepID=A0A8B7TQN4_CASCN
MGLSPTLRREYGPSPSRFPLSGLKSSSRTTSTGSSDDQPAIGRSTVLHSGLTSFSPLELEETVESQALVQYLPKQSQQDMLEQGQSVQQGEKPVINLETALSPKRPELKSPKPESEGKLEKQATEVKIRPRPGDLIEIFRIGYEHWAIYVEDDCVVHLAPPSDEFEVGSITSIFSNHAVVKYSRLEDVLHGCSWKVNNKLDGTYLPLPVDKIIQRTKNMVNKIVQYSLIDGNCEHFVNNLRYGVARSQQVEHILMEGAKAAGAVISAVMETIRPKPLTS